MRKRTVTIIFYLMIATAVLFITHWGSTSITVLSENLPILRRHHIIIDAGHGGVDGGAISCTGKRESMYNLEISLKLRDMMQLLGYETTMTRTEDISIYTTGETIAGKKASDLKERVGIVNQADNAVLLSIHQNTFSDSQYSGAQVFYAETNGSKELAELLQKAFTRYIDPQNKRTAKKSSGVYLMEHIQKPGILVECGFLSNPEEEARLNNPAYQKRLCCVIAAAVGQYLSNT